MAQSLGLESHTAVSRWERNERVPSRLVLKRLLELAVEPQEIGPLQRALGEPIGIDQLSLSSDPVRENNDSLVRKQLEAVNRELATADSGERFALVNALRVHRKGGRWARMLMEVIHSVTFPQGGDYLTPRVLRFLAEAGPADRARILNAIDGPTKEPIPDDRLRRYLNEIALRLSVDEDDAELLQPKVEDLEREILEAEEKLTSESEPVDAREKALVSAAVALYRARRNSPIAQSVIRLLETVAETDPELSGLRALGTPAAPTGRRG